MAKLKQDAITINDIEEYLQETSDFQLEISVIKTCVQLGLRVLHGGFYKDPFSNKTRQFDIQARDNSGDLRIGFAIECKNLALNFPLIVSSLPRDADIATHSILNIKRYPRSGFPPEYIIKKITNSNIYKEHEPVGKEMTQLGRVTHDDRLTTGDTEVYDKWSQAISQYYGLYENYKNEVAQIETVKNIFVLPILVVPNETLWLAKYNLSGTLIAKPEKIDHVEYFIGMPNEQIDIQLPIPTHLHIVTIAELEDFLRKYLHSPVVSKAILGD